MFTHEADQQLPKIFRDPQLQIGNSELLNRYKNDSNTNLPVSIPQGLNVSDTIIAMEKLLKAAIEKDQQILKAAKNLNILQKKDLLYLNEKAGKKISSDEVYVLSQKNLAQTLDYLNEKSKFKIQKEKQADRVNEEMKEETKEVEVPLENPEPEIKHSQDIPKPIPSSGLKRTANMISRLFGGNEVKRKFQKRFEKTFDDVLEFLESSSKKQEDQRQPFVDLTQIIQVSMPLDLEQVNNPNSLLLH